MRVLALREIPDDHVLRERWDALVQRTEHPEVFYTYEWAIAVQRSYGSVLRPLLLLGYEEESLVGVAALALKSDGGISFLAETTGDYCDLLSSPDRREHWCDAVFGELQRLSAGPVTLANLPVDSSTAALLSRVAGRHGYRSFVRPAYACSRIALGDEEKRAALRRMKKDLRRNFSLLGQRGPTVFCANANPDEVYDLVNSFCEAHVGRFLTTGRLSNMIRPERRHFLKELAGQLSTRGWLRLSRLLVGDRCVAWNYGFEFAGSWFWYQPTFDTSYERFSPGLCLLGKIVECACDIPGINVVDLGLGAEGYKERFATESRSTVHATLTQSSIFCAKKMVRYRASEMIKARPETERRIRAIANGISRLRLRVLRRGPQDPLLFLSQGLEERAAKHRELNFFEWVSGQAGTPAPALSIRELDAKILGVSAIEYCDDGATLGYLLRSARRFRQGSARGFSLLNADEIPVHFCWVTTFESFATEKLLPQLPLAPSSAPVIFEAWTPATMRRRGYFATALAQLANRLESSGQIPWALAATKDKACLNGILRAGFDYRFTTHGRRSMRTKTVLETSYPAPRSQKAATPVQDFAPSQN